MNAKEMVLAVLMRGPATGYDIKKEFEFVLSPFLDVSASGVYPALNDLAKEGLVTFKKVEQEGRPNKKIYEVTQAGKEKFLDVACNSVELRHSFHSEVFFILTVAQHMPPERVDQILDQWIKFSVDRLDTVESMIEEAEEQNREGLRFVLGMSRASMDAIMDYAKKERGKLSAALTHRWEEAPPPNGARERERVSI